MFKSTTPLCNVTPICAHIPPSTLPGFSSMWLLCHCDRDHSVCQPDKPGHFLQLTADWTCRQVSVIMFKRFLYDNERKRGNSNLFESETCIRNTYFQRGLQWPSQVSFQMDNNPPPPFSQNKWIIRAETFPHILGLSECRAAFVSVSLALLALQLHYCHHFPLL